MKLLAKGKERNQELMKLSELQYKAHELLQYQQVRKLQVNTSLHCVCPVQAGSSKDMLTKFNNLKQQNLPTISE